MNKQEALKWLHKAAEKGNTKAQCDLGVYYLDDNVVVRDEQEALKWLHKAANKEKLSLI